MKQCEVKVVLLVSTLGACRTGSSDGPLLETSWWWSLPAGRVGRDRRDRRGKVIVLLTFKTVRHLLKWSRWSAASRARLAALSHYLTDPYAAHLTQRLTSLPFACLIITHRVP